MKKSLFLSFLLGALVMFGSSAFAYQFVDWASAPAFAVHEWNASNGLPEGDVPTDEYSSLMEQAEALAADDDAVAVGKLREAIQWAKDNNDESRLQAAIDQFLADNADLEKDETSRVGTDMGSWNVGSGNGSQKNTYTHNGITLIEHFGETRVGTMLWQEVSVEPGTYNIELYATSHNAWNGSYMPVSADNPAPSLQEDANDVAYVFATSAGVTMQTWITARRNSGMLSFEPETYAINDVLVLDGKLTIGLALARAGQTEWHTIQIKSLKWITTAKQAFAALTSQLGELVAEGLILYRDDNMTNGRAEFREVLEVGEYAMSFTNMYNIPEMEEVVENLRAALATFKKANYYIDFAAGEYFVQSLDDLGMMAAGHDWGTRGISAPWGLDLILTPNPVTRGVTINSRVSNGGNQQYLGTNLYMDSDECEWFFELQGSHFDNPYVYISNGEGQYISVDNTNNLVMSNTPYEWILVPVEELIQYRLEEFSYASEYFPMDATFLLQNPTFNRNDLRTSAWEVSSDCTDKTLGGPLYSNVENYCAESYHSTFTISQTIADAPAGKYQLTAQGFYRQEDGFTEDAPRFFIGNQMAELPVIAGSENSMADAAISFYEGLYTIEPITFVYDGNGGLTVGILGTAVHQWVIFDNFQLTYLGEAEAPQEHEYVDLGLPSGTLWATCNVGAENPEDYGDYFAWGETEPKEEYSWGTYFDTEDGGDTFKKYDVGMTEVLPEDDAATVNWGTEWQMPSYSQIEELINSNYTTSKWTTENGVNGWKITSKSNGYSIFLPAAGFFNDTNHNGAGSYGHYWSRSLYANSSGIACGLYFYSDNIFMGSYNRCYGQTVRPVRVQKKEEHDYVDLGLPSGTLWATCNVGAENPEDYGDYFAWGETQPKEDYGDETSYIISDYISAKYNVDAGTGILTSLQPEDDAATANWGNDWQMPNEAQLKELISEEYTTSEWTQLNGVNGRLITSKSNGNSIFLPAAGFCYTDGWMVRLGEQGNYWTRILNPGYHSASEIYFKSNVFAHYLAVPQMCLSVRPVRYTEPVLVSSVNLSDTSLRMEVGTFRLLTATVEPESADNNYVVWKSSDKNVAAMFGDKVEAYSAGTCTITCYATDGSGVKAECQITVFEPEEHDYVDLGLPSGTLWATCNVGANSPEEYGDYFAWGETEPKEEYSWETYQHCNGSPRQLTKYCYDYYGDEYFMDMKTELQSVDDAATANWGSLWQTPSPAQFEELFDEQYTTTEYVEQNGVCGRKITSKINNNSIFIPAAGVYNGTNLERANEGCYYWLRMLDVNLPSPTGLGMFFHWSIIRQEEYERCSGLTVRPVRKQEVYTEFVEETGTLTYYYDYDRASRSGVTELYDPVNIWGNIRSNNYSGNVIKAVIDPSMKHATLTSTMDMFSYCKMTSIEGLENLNTDYVTDMKNMFDYCSELKALDLSSFNTSNVMNMTLMFRGCSALQILDLTSFDISKVESMLQMFDHCSELTTICCFGDWSTSSVLNTNLMFRGCEKLVGGMGTAFDGDVTDATYARPDGGTDSPGYFTTETMATGISITPAPSSREGEIYNLAGQRLGKMQKGINIVGGRKVLVK